MFNRKTDPRQFIMSYEAAIASAGGTDMVLDKSFVIAAEGDALAWYTMLRTGSIYSWENLHDKISTNFKGFSSEPLTASDLFHCKQLKEETLRDYYQWFVQIKARAPKVPEDVAIESAIEGLRIGPFAAHLAREKTASMDRLYQEFEKYCRSDNDLRKRLEEQAQYKASQAANKGNPQAGRNYGQRQQPGQDRNVMTVNQLEAAARVISGTLFLLVTFLFLLMGEEFMLPFYPSIGFLHPFFGC